MVAMAQGLQTGAAQGVFDTVKAALESAAQSAADAINTNLKTLMCTAAGCDSVSGPEAVGFLRTARLCGVGFSGHVGFHSNQQVICHLLHLAVQLALFPQGPLTNASQQAGAPLSALVPCEAQAGPVPSLETAVQTDPEPAPPPPRNYGPCVGVRIGGGYHLFHAPDDGNMVGQQAAASGAATPPTPAARTQSPAPRPRPLLEDVAAETVRLSSVGKISPPDGRTEMPDETCQNMYTFGARSEGTRCDRFRVGAYLPSAGDAATVIADRDLRDAKRRRDGDGVVLYRVLGRAATRPDGPANSSSKQRPRRPGSAHTAKSARAAPERPASAEARSSPSPSTLAAVRRLREWAASDSETPPPMATLSVGRPFLADW